MNGPQLDKNRSLEIFSKKKKNKIIQNSKIIFAIFLTNTFTYILTDKTVVIPNKPISKISKSSVMISIPLKLFLPLNKGTKTAITLITEDKKLVIKNCFIHKKVTPPNIKYNNQNGDYYNIELNQIDASKAFEHLGKLQAYPRNIHFKIKNGQSIGQKKRGIHEIIF